MQLSLNSYLFGISLIHLRHNMSVILVPGGGQCTDIRSLHCDVSPTFDKCYSRFEECNGVKDCNNGRDEYECRYNEVTCEETLVLFYFKPNEVLNKTVLQNL